MKNEVVIYKPTTAIERRRELAKIPAVLSSLDRVEKAVFLASTAKTISEYDSVDLIAELAKALPYIFKDVGYKNTDESEMKYLIIRIGEILKRYYFGMTIKDFRMAFEMAITGELDDYLPKGRDGQIDRGHYQQFNAEYVCKIMNAYKVRRAWILKKANESAPKQEPARDPERERFFSNQIRKDCINAFEFYKENGRMPEISPIAEMLYYKILSSVGLAKDIEVTEQEKKITLQRMINTSIRNGLDWNARELESIGIEHPVILQGSYLLARRRALNETFAKMVEDGIEITDFIKF